MVLSLNRQFSGAGWSECIEGVCCTSISLMNIERMNDIYICIVTSIVFISMSTPSFVILKLLCSLSYSAHILLEFNSSRILSD